MLVDTHAHLYLKQFKKDISETVERAQAILSHIFLPNIDLESVEDLHDLVEKYPTLCYPMLGLHPCSVTKDFEKTLYYFENLLKKQKYYAIGETGTDLYWDKTLLAEQIAALEIQIQWAKEYRLPLVLHCRESFLPTIELIEKHQDGRLTGVFHCFTGTMEEAQRVMATGFYLGIGGVLTYKTSTLKEVIAQVGLSKVVLETDCPYLPPVPYRGKRNEPAYIQYVADALAQAVSFSTEQVATQTTQNALDLFQI